ncbi:cobalamin-binding protein [Thalassolituus oleivorans]|uniref:cobalamin-binding protein n=1 Tax=Thalassolituus oleivorans TaxID=187493 RepID=UPI0023F48EF1|nr:cobalamin-binding protein [Thalassolituus oleivorans]
MKTRFVFIFLCCCFNASFTLAQSSESFDLIDDAGVEHHFSGPVKRIVSLMPHGTELLFEVGAGDLIVGAVDYSDYPEAAKKIPRIGGYSGMNIEAILALQPDIVLAWPEGNPNRELQKLTALGVPLFVSDPVTFDGIAVNLERLGILTGHKESGAIAAQVLRQQVDKLKRTYQQSARVRVFYQVWNQPLITQNGDTFISQAIDLCGGHNVFADLDIRAPHINMEAVLVADPDVIVASGMGESRPEWLDDWKQFPKLNAVKYANLFHIHPDLFHRPTSRFLQGTQQLCEHLTTAREHMAAK